MAVTKWMYCTDEIEGEKLDSTLDEWGERGWELVSLVLYPLPKDAEGKEANMSDLFLAVFKIQSPANDFTQSDSRTSEDQQ
jgi:hypothetical protein